MVRPIPVALLLCFGLSSFQSFAQVTSPTGLGSGQANANYLAGLATFKDRQEAIRLNGIATRAQSALPSGATASNTFGTSLLKNTGSDLALQSKGSLTVGGRPLVIDVEAKLIKPSLVGALGRFAGKVIPILNVGVAMYDLTKELDGWGVEKDPVTGLPQFTKTEDGIECQSDCFEYTVANGWPFGAYQWSPSPAHAVNSWGATVANANTKYSFLSVNADKTIATIQVSTKSNIFDYSCMCISAPDTVSTIQRELWKRSIPPFNTSKIVPATKEEWAAEIGNSPTIAQSPKIGDLIRDLISSGEEIQTSPPSVTGPSTSPGTTSTTSNPDGSTSTTTTTNHFQYDGDNITHNTTSVVETCTGVGSCSTTSTTTTNPAPAPGDTPADKPEDEISVSDSPFGPIPELYTPKFPDGLVGVWTARKAEINGSSLATLTGVLLPPMSESGGTCPDWQIDLNMASYADYGSWNVAPPCWIWDFAKVIVIISSLLLARALVFGG